jgi:hypothetical protein
MSLRLNFGAMVTQTKKENKGIARLQPETQKKINHNADKWGKQQERVQRNKANAAPPEEHRAKH